MISLKSENQILKHYINDNKLQNVNITTQLDLPAKHGAKNIVTVEQSSSSNESVEEFFSDPITANNIHQIFHSLDANLSNYYYSYSKFDCRIDQIN